MGLGSMLAALGLRLSGLLRLGERVCVEEPLLKDVKPEILKP